MTLAQTASSCPVLLLLCFGCRSLESGGQLERTFAERGPLSQFRWVGEYSLQSKPGAILTIDTTAGSSDGTVQERRVVNGAVVCNLIAREGAQVKKTHRYSLATNGACSTFESLYRGVAATGDYVIPGYSDAAIPRFAFCMILSGPESHFVYVEDGVIRTSAAVDQLFAWHERMLNGESIEDGDLAASLLGGGTFGSPAVLVLFALDAFDQICEIAYSETQKPNADS